ncbi:hypothetical protein FEM48_Zijuj05G0024400 [Ziziphus jujuba var. spinosa]|uniref:Uncharacterized protein n=1 Tax=Ziziphus jujuba var. spinosa TaxID=714518 RepID=A0A978VCA0_ZIZJJ|nr:hypothetical protein FEM48_Zijuj05G0024400 [Ziziphus jujuba var. spinosa]
MAAMETARGGELRAQFLRPSTTTSSMPSSPSSASSNMLCRLEILVLIVIDYFRMTNQPIIAGIDGVKVVLNQNTNEVVSSIGGQKIKIVGLVGTSE